MGKRNSTIAGAAILSLAIAGCASEGTPEATTPSPTAVSPSPTTALVNKSPGTVQSFKNPVVTAKNPSQNVSQVASATPNLIQPTNATERAIVIAKGRNDPFAQIVGPTVVETGTNTTKQVPNLPPLPITRNKNAVATVPKRSQVISVHLPPKKPPSLTPVLPKVLPPVVPDHSLVSVLPKPAQPDLAKAVFVSGVVLLGNKLQAIIKVPDEPTSLYVQAGQRLANGLLIKRIEMNQGDNPVVIVEQYGIEVARMVGEAPSASAGAGNPGSATTPPQNSVNTGAT